MLDSERGGAMAPELRILDGVASWCGGLHGSMPLNEALAALAHGLAAEMAVITRHQRVDDRSRAVAIHDARAGRVELPMRRGFCADVLGELYNRARAGSVFFLSDLLREPDWRASAGLSSWLVSRGVGEVVVVAMAGTAQQHDYIEFHFARSLERVERQEIEAVVPTIVRSWSGRKTGLVTQAQMDDRMIRARAAAQASKPGPEAPILGMSNPARLSRAEFRVCLLLSRGLSVKGVTDELGLSEATVRSHLRSIYSKTETTGLAELLYRILSARTEQADAGYGTY